MAECEWKGGCTIAASPPRLVGPWNVCARHYSAILASIREQAEGDPAVRALLLELNPKPPIRLNPRPAARQLVYFAQREELIKIGISSNVEKRINEIGRGSSMPPGMTVGPVELLGTVAGGRAREGQLHDRFQAAHHWGEWFRAVPELLSFIKQEAES